MRKALSWLIKGSTLFCLLPWEPIAAQIVPDATLRVNSSVTREGNNTSAITGGTQVGSNLFHSFGQFSVPTGSAVYFKNAPDIQNILTRVTGSSISNIDGLIRANGIANVFLINPNGIIFGPNASLNIGGSFFGTTASNIKFADGISFDAKPLSSAEPLLTVSVPVGLGFGTNAGNIRVFGDGQGIRKTSNLIDTSSGLRVQPNQTLALVGGDIVLSRGTLKTTGGQIELGSVAGTGLVNLIPTDKGWTLGYSGISAFGEIQLSGAAAVDASGNGGGNIQIQARKLMLDGGSQIESSTLGAGTAGTLKINASDSVNLVGLPEVDSFFNTGISSLVYPKATGSGGNINIETGRLSVRDGAGIAAGTYGFGNAGSIEVLAHDSVEVLRKPTANAGSSITSLAQRGSTGSGGNINIETARLSLRSGGVISSGTFGQGSGGNVSITADEEVQVTGKSITGNSPSRISAIVIQSSDPAQAVKKEKEFLKNQAASLTSSGHEQLALDRANEALKTWQESTKIYRQLNDQEGITESLINQNLAFQALGLHKQACNILLEALKLNPNLGICDTMQQPAPTQKEQLTAVIGKQQPTSVNLLGLQNLGEVLRILGQLNESETVLQETLTLAKLVSSSNISGIYLSLGNIEQSIYQQLQDKYSWIEEPLFREQIANIIPQKVQKSLWDYQTLENIPNISKSAKLQAQLNHLTLLISWEKWLSHQPNQANLHLKINQQIRVLVNQIDENSSAFLELSPEPSIHARLNLANNLSQIPSPPFY